MAFKGFGKSSGPEMPPQSQTPFGHFPRPPSPPTTFTPSIPNYSAIQRSPRAFGAPDQSLSPSSTVSGIHPATGLLHVSSTGNGPPLQWVDSENSVGRNFGNEMHIRLSASSVRPRANSASKMSWIPGPEARAPPHIYADDDIWMNSRDDSTGGHSELSIDDRGQLFPSRRQSPPLAFLSNHSNMDAYHPMDRTRRPGLSSDGWGNQSKLVSDSDSLLNRRSRSPTEIADALVSKHSRYPNLSSTDEVVQKSSRINQHEASERHSLSPPRLSTQKNVPGNPAFPNLRSSTTSHGVNSDNVVHKPASYAVSKRTRSPVSLVDQGFQEIQDDTERELQAKAKRLARFKAELSDPVENGPLGASRNFHSTKRDQSVTEKSVGEYSLGPTRDVGDEIDNEGSGSLSVIVGLCPDMCPESERAERERKGDLDQYERLDGDRNLTSKDLAVKKYNRTAEREAGLIRPLTILQKTMEYLLNLLDQPYDDCFLGLYNFLWDRMRAIRMDLRMQHIFNLEAIAMLEQMIRLHIIAMHELCEYTKGEGFSEGFDAHLNIEQMNKTSVELFQMYDDHRKKGVHVPTEKEFRGYYALLKLDKHPGYRVEPAELSLDLAKMTSEIRQTQEVLFARDVARSCRTGNFIAFFRLAKKASYLQACLMHAHFSKLRTQALASLHAGLQNNQGLPVAHVAKWLGMEAEDIESLLEYHGFLIKEFEEPYMVKEGPFLNNDRDYPTQCSELVHSKKSGTILEDVLSSHQVTSLPIEDDKELQLAKVKKREHTAALSIRTDGSLAIMDEEMSNSVMSSSPRYSMEIQHVPRMLRNAQQGSHQRSLASSPKGIVPVQPALEVANDHQQNKDFPQWTSRSSPMWNFSVPKFIPEAQPALYEWVDRPTANVPVVCSRETLICPEVKSTILDIMPRGVEQEKSTACLIDPVAERPLKHDVGVEELMGKETTDTQEVKEDEVVPSYYDEEVAEAKLKLLIRLWRRRSLRKRELREQNRIAASAALNVLPLGPPIWQNKHKPISYDKFDIDQVVCQRYVKHEKSFSRLNVSDVLASEFVERNANSNCICWKVVLGPQAHQSGKNTGHRAQAAHLPVQEWLHSKLLPCVKHENDDDLIVSIPGVSIWKKWLRDHSGGSTCCLSVVKDINFGNLNESVVGANAILYPVSESVPWETQKAQLHSLLTALPPGSHIPLLILSSSNEKEPIEPSSSIVDKLGLHDIDKSRIGSFLIVYIAESQDMRHLDSYFSDERLRKGLEWLAINSHRQPILCCIKTRDLVLTQLNSSLNALVQKGGHGIGPDHCISVFNEALDQSIGYIIAAANVNPLGWPCPELSLLDKSTDEYKVVNWFLPTIGWSSAERVEPLVSGLRHSKLPAFSDDLSWLTRGYNTGKGIEEQRQCLQDSLVRYLTQSSNMMNTALATKEANVILQKFTRLELHDTSYYLVPSWVPIFHRIFNWRLNILAHGACASAYILEQHHFSLLVLQKLAVEATPSMCDHPSLDEMVEISRGLILSERVCSEPPRASQPIPTMIEVGYNAVKATKTSTSGSNPEEVEKSSYMVDTARHGSRNQLVTVDVNLSHKFEEHSEVLLTLKAARETDRLSKLLEQCNILQNKNEEKLWVYF